MKSKRENFDFGPRLSISISSDIHCGCYHVNVSYSKRITHVQLYFLVLSDIWPSVHCGIILLVSIVIY